MTRLQGFPDFFIIGAPRCGTTSLSRYLMRHPQICFSRPKETHYFTRLSELPSEDAIKHDYIDRYFSHRTGETRAAGEGSVSYLHLPESIEWIRHFNPDAKFIVMVRNPLTMLPSYHQRMLFLFQETEKDFARAWALQPARARGENIPDTCLDSRVLNYRECASFGARIERCSTMLAVTGYILSCLMILPQTPCRCTAPCLTSWGLTTMVRPNSSDALKARCIDTIGSSACY